MSYTAEIVCPCFMLRISHSLDVSATSCYNMLKSDLLTWSLMFSRTAYCAVRWLFYCLLVSMLAKTVLH